MADFISMRNHARELFDVRISVEKEISNPEDEKMLLRSGMMSLMHTMTTVMPTRRQDGKIFHPTREFESAGTYSNKQ